MNRTELMNSLAVARRRGVPEPIIEDMRRDGLDEIARRKSLNAMRIKVEGMWREKILPLQEEKKRVVASLAYPTHNRNNLLQLHRRRRQILTASSMRRIPGHIDGTGLQRPDRPLLHDARRHRHQ